MERETKNGAGRMAWIYQCIAESGQYEGGGSFNSEFGRLVLDNRNGLLLTVGS